MAIRDSCRRLHSRPLAWCLLSSLLSAAAPAETEHEGRELFEARIRPVLVEHCYPCHSGKSARPKAGLRLDTREGLLRGGISGPVVVAGAPDRSSLIQAIAQTGDVSDMPPRGDPLPKAVVADFRRWVALGAPDPRVDTTAKPALDPLDWWSLRPLSKPQVPGSKAAHPVDAFIEATLREKALEPAPEADRRVLLRRLAFDLTGLPPTPEEVETFLHDDRPDAYERQVDRLLASPHHGERAARRWMDLVHFAETHGHDQDRIRPNAWRYRDYLIEAFNQDTPYARFVQEQVAADVLFPEEPQLTPALGFLAAGPWDESSLRDIRDDSVDRKIGHYLDRDDIVMTVMSTFVSATVHCARCHDHKFDPISQVDYYSLQAVFAGVDKAERGYDADPEVSLRRKTLTAKLAALHRKDAALMDSLLGPDMRSQVGAWERRQSERGVVWTVIDPEQTLSSGGATLSEQADHSVLAAGNRPPRDTYTIDAVANEGRVTAVRLELIPDDRLPKHGPGRNENGNLHLTEFRLFAGSRPIAIKAASSDYDQPGWGVAAAIDGNEGTAWGIYPEVGKPHQAVFELAEALPQGSPLKIVLLQSNPINHPIGRFRLAVTGAPGPVRVTPWPDSIASILANPDATRSDGQRRELAAFYLASSLEAKIAALPPKQFVYAAAADFAPDGGHVPPGGPRPVHVLRRGDIGQPGVVARPGTLSCLKGLEARFDATAEEDRRVALARWLTAPENPLTWRSIVNRVWQDHFGRGLVETPSDFGRMGSEPTHPELLDWLAVAFRDGGGSLKDLRRLIVTSATYRRSTRHDDRAAEVDSDNRWLWRQNRRRLDAEAVRDAILMASGQLDRTMGGPSIRQFALSAGVHVTPVVDYDRYDWQSPGSGRRSVYRFLFRTLPDPFMDILDAADASQLTPVRNESASALQALALLNNRFILGRAGLLARRLEAAAPGTRERIVLGFEWTLGRPPTTDELQDWSAFADRNGLAEVCRLLFNGNEFLFIN